MQAPRKTALFYSAVAGSVSLIAVLCNIGASKAKAFMNRSPAVRLQPIPKET